MIDRDHKLPLARQAKAVSISRGSIYYRPRPVGEAGLGLMRRIDELHLEYPFAGSRMMRGLLRQEGLSCGRRHIATLMRRMGIEALYRKPNTSRRRPGHMVYPYLLRGLEVSRPNQVWAMDITYIPMARGFVYLAAVMDWHSRKVLAWRVSVTMDTDFCVEALEESLGRHGAPEIFNTDQGSQFTSDAFTGLLKANGIQISMDGKGSWKDNVFVERLQEEVYLRAYESVPEARARAVLRVLQCRTAGMTPGQSACPGRPNARQRDGQRCSDVLIIAIGAPWSIGACNPAGIYIACGEARH